jgi:mannose-6-phosphate isomerase-like protein (cupin superfamily)
LHNKLFVSADGATISIQDGNGPKRVHSNANEMQYILEGTGTIWLGNKEVRVRPGDLVIIPKGTRMAAPSQTAACSSRSRSRRRRRRRTTSRC